MPSFGYGVGDFIAVGTLVGQVVKGLVESRDASNDCQSLIATLQSISAAIEVAKNIFDTGRGNPASVNGIKHELVICDKLITQFIEDSKEFTMMSCNVDRKGYIMNEIRKISWTMFKTGDIQRLQRNLQGHLHALNVYTSLLQCDLLLQATKHISTPGLPLADPPLSRSGGQVQERDPRSSSEGPKRSVPYSRGQSRVKSRSHATAKSTDSGYASPHSAGTRRQPPPLDQISVGGDPSSAPPERSPSDDISGYDWRLDEGTDSEASISPQPRERRTRSSNSSKKPPSRRQNPRYGSYYSHQGEEDSYSRVVEVDEHPARPHRDPETIRLEEELKTWKQMQEKNKEAERQREWEAKIRREAEETFQRRIEDMRMEQEMAKKEIESAKVKAEIAARERLEAERKAAEEKQMKEAEDWQKAEDRARETFETLMKQEEERKRNLEFERSKLEAAIKAEQEAKAAQKQGLSWYMRMFWPAQAQEE